MTADSPPPPISGGTLLVTSDGHTVVASDPDRDSVYIVDVASQTVTATIALQSGDEPGRIAEDWSGRAHIALRGGGALVTIDLQQGSVVARRPVCPAPRGVAWDASTDLVWVACATGELVAFPSAGGPAAQSLVVERDLRDVIVRNGSLSVTKFRSGEVLRLAGDGTITRRDALPPAMQTVLPGGSRQLSPHVAWHAIVAPSGGIAVTHQEEADEVIIVTGNQGAYGGSSLPTGAPGEPIVAGELSVVEDDGSTSTQSLPGGVLPVDVAFCPYGTCAAVVSAGAAFTTGLSSVSLVKFGEGAGPLPPTLPKLVEAQPIAVAFDAAGDLLVQSREPAALYVVPTAEIGPWTSISLSSASRADSGHAIFHTQAGGLIACASCHPEGGDDGKVWLLNNRSRRTPSLLGTISGTAPYHWPGDEASLEALVNDVYTRRMNGALLGVTQMTALNAWVEGLPAPPSPSWVDAQAAQRGRALFEGAAACSACHSGPKLTNNATMDVGTSESLSAGLDGGAVAAPFQVPPLVGVGWRMPLMHDGCATTMQDRFGRCATPRHGSTSNLSAQDISDLTAYLESL